MNSTEFALNPAYYGIPDQQQLKDLRIWSDHYHGFAGGLKQHKEMMFYVERMGIEKVISLDIGSIEDDALVPSPIDNEEREILEKNKDLSKKPRIIALFFDIINKWYSDSRSFFRIIGEIP